MIWESALLHTFRALGHISKPRDAQFFERRRYGQVDISQPKHQKKLRRDNDISAYWTRTFEAPYLVIKVTLPNSLSGLTTKSL